ncbi:hypothetical protein PoB_002984600 [Plakobranchus ocellatus]|uniref:Uncharacterized protein n=1 Tax=Plakobranchus ocellatus TaxID=259542 RepID=A0AAV3ZWK3_9GAST|nr:hypothetical protein PoB_002984600 [Plakobranchus ocellatus]
MKDNPGVPTAADGDNIVVCLSQALPMHQEGHHLLQRLDEKRSSYIEDKKEALRQARTPRVLADLREGEENCTAGHATKASGLSKTILRCAEQMKTWYGRQKRGWRANIAEQGRYCRSPVSWPWLSQGERAAAAFITTQRP